MRATAHIAAVLFFAGSGLLTAAAATNRADPNLSTRDPRVREYILPGRILWRTANAGCAVEHADELLQRFSGQVTLNQTNGCVLRNNGKPPGILLDFGRELQGGVELAIGELLTSSAKNRTARVRIRFGESASEAMSEPGGEDNSTNDHAIRDQTLLVPMLGTVETGDTGFRFIRIDLLETNCMVSLRSVRAVFVHRDLPQPGSFRCSDERLNRIWQTGAYTVFLNMQGYLWDGIKRDRLVWVGDMHPEMQTISAVYGALPVVSASLDLIRSETPLPNWMNGISSYSVWWLIIQRDWFRYTGDMNYLRLQQEYMAGLVKQLAASIGPDNEEVLPQLRFLDWPSSPNRRAVHAGLHALMLLGFQAAGELAEALKDEATRQLCTASEARLRMHVPDPAGSKQAAALMVLAGLAPAEKLNRELLAVDGAKRLSTFYGYYVLQARAQAGDYQGCLDLIRSYWGGMLDAGATTFWEDFDIEWVKGAGRIDELTPPGKKDLHGGFGGYSYKGYRKSLCHGWASGPTAWLSREVLGVHILESGCAAVKLEPHLGDLQWAEGSFPTPKGNILVRHEKQADGSVHTTFQAPPGIRIIR